MSVCVSSKPALNSSLIGRQISIKEWFCFTFYDHRLDIESDISSLYHYKKNRMKVYGDGQQRTKKKHECVKTENYK